MNNNWDEEINELSTKCFEINNEVEKAKYFLSQMKILEDIKLEVSQYENQISDSNFIDICRINNLDIYFFKQAIEDIFIPHRDNCAKLKPEWKKINENKDPNLLISKQFVSKVRKELIKMFPKIGYRYEK